MKDEGKEQEENEEKERERKEGEGVTRELKGEKEGKGAKGRKEK